MIFETIINILYTTSLHDVFLNVFIYFIPQFSLLYLLTGIIQTYFVHTFYIILLFLEFLIIYRWLRIKLKKQKHTFETFFQDKTEELREQVKTLHKKNKKNEELLSNMLPQETANEIKSFGKAASHRFDTVTILFADIQGFTKIAELMNPEALIDELDKIFIYFDSVAEKYNIEKIKTIGDAYMCAGGIPIKNRTNPIEVVMAAIEMQEHLKYLHQHNKNNFSKIWNLRIGVHTGPVIAGVVGKKKFTYDIWGDSVNVASRMESSGDIGKVNISSMTYEFVKDFFICEFRGKMPVKYKGEIEMYFVSGIRPELTEAGNAIIPNKKFFAKIGLIRFQDLEESFLKKLSEKIPEQLVFHNTQFIVDLINRSELICLGEEIQEEDLIIIKTAALFYFSGMVIDYKNFVDNSINFVKETLPAFSYSEKEIEAICNIIKLGINLLNAKTVAQKIIADAYFDYLGSFDYLSITRLMFKELSFYEKVENVESFYKGQLKLLKQHRFFNSITSILRDVDKNDQIEKISKFISHQNNEKTLHFK
jgi:class 3 adenylate cyclase